MVDKRNPGSKEHYWNQKLEDRKEALILLGVLILIAAAGAISSTTGISRPGAFHEKSEYTAKVMVNVFPNKERTKNYRLPADVSHHDNYYQIENIYWPNGEVMNIQGSDCNTLDSNKEFEVQCSVVDDNGTETEYTVEITGKLVE